MDKKKSIASGYSSSEQKTKSASTMPKAAAAPTRAQIRMVQNVLLIWVDSKIDEANNADCRHTVSQLRRVVNNINTFTNGDQCVDFITDKEDENVCTIISGSLGQLIVPIIHDMSQVDTIFFFCDNRKRHEQWAKEWPKIKGVFTEITSICEALKEAAHQCEHNSISISFMATTGTSNKKLDELDSSFMYTQILKEILLTIQFEEQHIQEYINYCREQFADSERELNNVKQLEIKYRDKTPIWWYTYECFLYPMLNRALRTMEVDVIIKMGFFIGDLHRHIERLHAEQYGGHQSAHTFTVYRGQGLSKTDFDQMIQTKGGLMAFNNFLSTSKTRDVSLTFARRALKNPDLVGILFVMSIDSSISSTPFASIVDVSYFKEDEVLFAMHTVFRIRDIKSMGENNRLWKVDLTLTSDNDPEVRALTDRMREETFPSQEGWERLGLILLKMGQSDKAQQVYGVLLGQASDEGEKAPIYHQLGRTKQNQGEYKEAIIFYEKALEIDQKTLPPNHPDLGSSYNNIGNVYRNMGEYSKALSYYEKSLEIDQKTLPPNHPDVGGSYNNIGSVYYSMGEYSKALSYYEKALEIKQKTLPSNHPDLGVSYNNIGMVYRNMGEYSKALSYYEKSLEIQQKTLPPNHPELGGSYNNMGAVYSNMGEYSKALSYYEKDLEIQQKTLPPNHPDLGSSYNNIGNVYQQMGEYSKALSYYEKDLEISKKTLPPNHPDLGMSYNNIGIVYRKMGEYSKALSFCERAIDIGQRSLPSNHPHLQLNRNNLEDVKKKL